MSHGDSEAAQLLPSYRTGPLAEKLGAWQTNAGRPGWAAEGGDSRGNRHKPPGVFGGRALHKSCEHDDMGCTQYNDLKRELALLDETTTVMRHFR